ncbi:hypothetical protein [Streptomyces megasporus]|uniref:hypothetical protein n=1 Tax=Streptomyces megasporus TaxID=44060 RepID=UPI0012FEB4A3|nr:hypothetical protein [Streptomyces megasporus]
MSEQIKRDVFLRDLRRSLEQLSWNAERQFAYVDDLGVDVDEIALEFDDLFRIAESMATQGLISTDFFTRLKGIDSQLSTMTRKGAEVWEREKVKSSKEWETLRKLATETLKAASDA